VITDVHIPTITAGMLCRNDRQSQLVAAISASHLLNSLVYG